MAWILILGIIGAFGMDELKYDSNCHKKACYYYGEHTSM